MVTPMSGTPHGPPTYWVLGGNPALTQPCSKVFVQVLVGIANSVVKSSWNFPSYIYVHNIQLISWKTCTTGIIIIITTVHSSPIFVHNCWPLSTACGVE